MLHPFPLFLSLSSFSFFFLPATANTTYLLSTYLYFIYLRVIRYTDKQACFYFIPLYFFVSSFQCFAWLYICFWSVPLSLSLSSSTDPPHPHFTTQNRWLPHSLIFLFFRFQKFFVEKMRYDLFTFCMCLFRYWMFTFRCGFVCSWIGV